MNRLPRRLRRPSFLRPMVAGTALAVIAAPALHQAAVAAPQSSPSAVAPVGAVPFAGDALAHLEFDSRAAAAPLAPTAAQRRAVAALGDVVVRWNATGTPRTIDAGAGFLSGPSSAAPLTIARAWLARHAAAFGLTSAQVRALRVVRDHPLPGVGARVISLAQTFDGVPSGYGAIMTLLIDRRGRVASYAGDTVRGADLGGSFDLTPRQALTAAVAALAPDLTGFAPVDTGTVAGGYRVFDGGVLGARQYVRRVAFPTAQGARAAYAVLSILGADHAYATIVDARTGRPLLRKSLVQWESDGTVFENYPGAPRGGKPVVRSFGPTAQSPGGYVDPSGTAGAPGVTLLGNNADAAKAWTVPLVAADQYNRTVSPTSSFRFDFPDAWRRSKGATGSFVQDADAASTNLFWHHNRIHDEYYQFGFTESGGDFQLLNTGGGSTPAGGDPIVGGAQSGALNLTSEVIDLGRNNANMLTLPDGIPGFTNMYLWEPVDDAFEGQPRDGDFDATIIQHEYSHGLSNRYVGGGGLGSLGTTESGAMGEGWGDWYAMNHLFREGLSRTAVVAAYVGDPHRGIRNWNYAESPLTLGDYGYDLTGPEVHADGEIWTATLWELRSQILRAVGGDQRRASDVAEHLVTDAMPISPQAPSMLDMRDAIVKAARLRYGTRYLDAVWTAFANRGMGVSAKVAGETDTDPRPGFDVPTAARNGRLRFVVTNASTGRPVEGVRLLGGEFEARATPFATTDAAGRARAAFVRGSHLLTIQAPGFGLTHTTLRVTGSRTVRLAIRPNVLSAQTGAKVVKVTSEQDATPAAALLDDTEATSWRTADAGTAYNAGRKAQATIRLGRSARIDTLAVSVYKPTNAPRFAAARQVRVETSRDGRRWTTAKVASFSFDGPRPTAPDLNLQTLRLAEPVTASFVRVTPLRTFGDGAANAGTAIVAEVQAFGPTRGITPTRPRPDRPRTVSGSVAVGNPAQGSLVGLDPYKPGVTEASWTCPDLPSANGVDASFSRIPKGFGDGTHQARVKADVPIGEYQLWFYDSSCAAIDGGGFVTNGETTTIPAGAAYVGFLLGYGAQATYTIRLTDPS
ncbi:M36 family metallopeptidase [Nocardioides sp. TRM66260-LWL]|uniref:M36 family metallopeptidase n=1 Tax=Nocardioides sp. TRM66260-LWL TaxID=2874478 RepID=UPI001CC70717|nr:M36 family metallopeptidase [Nocardioides sp. TRM66260-LWL]MBZ5733663.1 M36 family metallopeptidase [Nocardioides sp. TRM66260-LWL]